MMLVYCDRTGHIEYIRTLDITEVFQFDILPSSSSRLETCWPLKDLTSWPDRRPLTPA